jgi:NitT/TauT family transport system substrate-binding protein
MTTVKRALGIGVVVSVMLCAVACTSGAATRSAGTHKSAISAARCATNRHAGTMTFVSPFGYDASAGIIDIFAAQSLGYFKAMCIDVAVSIPSYTTSPYIVVSSGRGTVTGEGSAADDLLEVANHANLVAIATFGDTSDYAILTKGSVTNLRELEGKTLGYHTVVPVVLSEMLANAKVDIAKVHEVNDTSYDPRLLVQGKFDAIQAYQSNEPLQLAAEGYKKGSAFREWLPSSLGVQGTFNVQIVNGTFLKQHRSTVADFLRAELKAAAYCIANARACVGIEQAAASRAHVTYNTAFALAEWRYESALVTHHTLSGKGIGVQSAAEWMPEYKAVLAYKLAKSLPPLSAIEDSALVASLYRGSTLIWP